MQKRNAIKTILPFTALFIFTNISAQSVGIGTNEPQEKLQVTGNLLIQQPYTFTNTAPTPAQTKTMVSGSNVSFLTTDSTGRIYDPGGPAGNYLDNLTATAIIPCCATDNYGIEIKIQHINLNSFDSVIITDDNGTIVFKVGNGFNTTSKTIYNTRSLTITFKSNNDGLTGSGFDIVFKRLYKDDATPGTNTAFGSVLYFDAANGVLRSGFLSSTQRGNFSAAMGYFASAAGRFSTSTGFYSESGGMASTAMGNGTNASGDFSTAMGGGTTAGGSSSTAMGFGTTASGDFSTALGYLTKASGEYSFSVGKSVTAAQRGSFFFGDSDPDNEGVTANGSPDEFVCRFNNGYYFMTSGGNNNDGTPRTGVRVLPGGNSWSAISDVRLKENFEPVDGESFLHKIGAMPQYTWNYKGQNALTYRHYGPMAQDFYKAFGKDKYGSIGCDTLINQQDFLGVNLVAIQALVKRTEMLSKENELLKQELAAIKKRLDEADSNKKSIAISRKKK